MSFVENNISFCNFTVYFLHMSLTKLLLFDRSLVIMPSDIVLLTDWVQPTLFLKLMMFLLTRNHLSLWMISMERPADLIMSLMDMAFWASINTNVPESALNAPTDATIIKLHSGFITSITSAQVFVTPAPVVAPAAPVLIAPAPVVTYSSVIGYGIPAAGFYSAQIPVTSYSNILEHGATISAPYEISESFIL